MRKRDGRTRDESPITIGCCLVLALGHLLRDPPEPAEHARKPNAGTWQQAQPQGRGIPAMLMRYATHARSVAVTVAICH